MGDRGPTQRGLLARTDALLDQVERLRLRDEVRLPAVLGDAIRDAAKSVGLAASAPATLASAHCYLLRLQSVLMAGWTRERAHLADSAPVVRAAGTQDLPPNALPDRDRFDSDAAWRAAVQLRVQRAHDAARYLSAQSAAAAVGPDRLAALRRTQADRARGAFEILRVEAEHRLGGSVEIESSPESIPRGRMRYGSLVIEMDFEVVVQQGRRVDLGPTEFRILAGLASNRGRIVTREALTQIVFGDDPAVDVQSRRLDVHMHNLRAKLGPLVSIETVYGIGWRVPAEPAGRLQEGPGAALRRRREARHDWAQNSTASPPSSVVQNRPKRRRRPGVG
jgi:DNA-binding winged helix-turn-helix (wHTH) protein